MITPHSSHNRIGIIAIATFLFFCLHSTVSAYYTTSQKSIALPNGETLFLIDYVFGHDTHDMYMPILVTDSKEQTTNAVHYEVRDADDHIATGTTRGIVVSDAAVTSDALYKIEKGSTKKFTLAIFFKPQQSAKKYHLQVTQLPFNFDRTQQLGLNQFELAHYRTK